MRQIITTPTQLSEIMRIRRGARNVSQQTLAAQLGLSQGRLSVIEGDPTNLSIGRLLLIAKLLGFELVIQDRTDAPTTAGW